MNKILLGSVLAVGMFLGVSANQGYAQEDSTVLWEYQTTDGSIAEAAFIGPTIPRGPAVDAAHVVIGVETYVNSAVTEAVRVISLDASTGQERWNQSIYGYERVLWIDRVQDATGDGKPDVLVTYKDRSDQNTYVSLLDGELGAIIFTESEGNQSVPTDVVAFHPVVGDYNADGKSNEILIRKSNWTKSNPSVIRAVK